MTDNFAVVRALALEIAAQFTVYANHHEAKNAMEKAKTNLAFRNKALEIADTLPAIEAELAALRENALDLSKMPEGRTVGMATLFDDSWSVWLRDKTKHLTEDKSAVNGIGPTLAAALSAAIARSGEEG